MAPSTTSPTRRQVAVIGGGISGLAAAQRARELDPGATVTLWEASHRLGGVLKTEIEDDWLLEQSADNFITDPPAAIELCRRIGFESELLPTDDRHRAAYVVARGKLQKLPDGFTLLTAARLGPIVASPILSWPGKLRLFAEALLPARRDDADESFASFGRRRLGREAFERLAQPLVSGIYTADPNKLSMRAALPRFVDMERRHGSLYRGIRAGKKQSGKDHHHSGARYSLFVAPKRGMQSLVEALAASLPQPSIHLAQRVERLERLPTGRWRLVIAGGEPQEADAVIVACASRHAASLLAPLDADLAAELAAIEYAGCVIAQIGYRREQIAHPLDAFGFVVPEIERRPILSCSFTSVKFPHRAPAGHVLLRAFLGGACQPHLHELDDDAIRQLALRELAELLGARGEPALFRVVRWQQAMPQYHVGHAERVDRIFSQARRLPGLALCGNAYRGVGVPACIESGQAAAAAVIGCNTPENAARI